MTAAAGDPEIQVCADAPELANRVAADLVAALGAAQSEGRTPALVLTGGSIARTIHESVAGSPGVARVDWTDVDVWFGDERFVPSDSDERNDGPGAAPLLDALPFDAAKLHRVPAADGAHGDAEAAAEVYAEELAGHDDDGPLFDVLMLGVGPDGHCASLFPGREEAADRRLAVAVHDSPKPPPTRITLTYAALNRAREVWFVAAGAEKAEAVRQALTERDVRRTPAAGVTGLERTVWVLDEAAASKLPGRPVEDR
jgi:6-phosphogluconolactonase